MKQKRNIVKLKNSI